MNPRTPSEAFKCECSFISTRLQIAQLVGQVPLAGVAKSLLALKLLLNVPVQLRQRREAVVPALVDEVEVRIGTHEASAFKVDEGEALVAVGGIMCGH